MFRRGGRNDRLYFGLALAETVAQNTNPATSVGGWGGDRSDAPSATLPWFARGGHSANTAGAGAFAFARLTGAADTQIGWRTRRSGDDGSGGRSRQSDWRDQ